MSLVASQNHCSSPIKVRKFGVADYLSGAIELAQVTLQKQSMEGCDIDVNVP